MEQDLGPGTVTTVYSYDAANQLNTAQQGSTAWQYTYDANGSLVSDGVKTYTYDPANRLKTATSGQSTVTSLSYNGLGQRLSMDAAGVIAYYVMDGDSPLSAESAGNTTFYLYGLGAIGEKTTSWAYSLPDGTNTPRQLSNSNGEVTLTARYTPWGDTLELNGTGNFAFGYFGGVIDAATGLIYVGNGQYYDPQTGRFLTRDAKPNNSNPYVPWDPSGAIIAPLGIVALFAGRKKKGSKLGTFLVLLLVLGSVGMTLAGCKAQDFGITPTNAPMPVAATATSTPDGLIAYTATAGIQQVSGTVAPTEALGYACTPSEVLMINPPQSQSVSIIHRSGPDANYGEYLWEVQFKLDQPAADDGWIVQEIEAHFEIYDKVTHTWGDYAKYGKSVWHFWEAWPVRKGQYTSFERDSIDRYKVSEDLHRPIGRDIVTGKVKFYVGDKEATTPWPHFPSKDYVPVGDGWEEWSKFNDENTLAGERPSTHIPPGFWDYCGTPHNFESYWNMEARANWGTRTWGGNTESWGTPQPLP